jgi:hypothetical protein
MLMARPAFIDGVCCAVLTTGASFRRADLVFFQLGADQVRYNIVSFVFDAAPTSVDTPAAIMLLCRVLLGLGALSCRPRQLTVTIHIACIVRHATPAYTIVCHTTGGESLSRIMNFTRSLILKWSNRQY